MYSFFIKSKNNNLDVVIVRVIFAVAATAAFVESQEYGIIGIIVGLILVIVSFFANWVKQQLKISSLALLVAGIALLCLITRSPYFALILVVHWLLEKYFNKDTGVDISENGIIISRPFNEKIYSWDAVQNVILKDGLLTIDLKNNHFMQTEVRFAGNDIEEQTFNQFCKIQLQKKQ